MIARRWAPRTTRPGPIAWGTAHAIGADGAPLCGAVIRPSWRSMDAPTVTCPACKRRTRTHPTED